MKIRICPNKKGCRGYTNDNCGSCKFGKMFNKLKRKIVNLQNKNKHKPKVYYTKNITVEELTLMLRESAKICNDTNCNNCKYFNIGCRHRLQAEHICEKLNEV